MTYELREGQYLVSTDQALLDIDRIHAFLTASYWAEGVPRDVVARSIKHSIPFGLFDGHAQIGFARAITDRATFAYLADVYVEEEYQGQGLGKLLMRAVMAHPDLHGLRHWMLARGTLTASTSSSGSLARATRTAGWRNLIRTSMPAASAEYD